MIVKEVLSLLENAVNPVAKVLKAGEQFKVIVLGFKKGMILKEHQTNISAKLVVVEGKVTYKEATRSLELNKFEELDIPINVTHSVEALEDSICFLMKG